MMKALLIGGPKNGTVLNVKGSGPISIFIEHDGKRYEYRSIPVVWDVGDEKVMCPVWAHGDIPDKKVILKMIQEENIVPEFLSPS